MAWKPDYITDDQLKDYERIDDDVDDAEIAWAITASSRAVDGTCYRQFGKTTAPVARRYTPWWSTSRRRWVITVDDFQSVTGLVVALDLDADEVFTDTVTDPVRKLPMNAAADGMPWTKLVLPDGIDLCGSEGEVEVTLDVWGWTDVPVTVEQATALQAARLLARRNSPFGVAGSPDVGSELRLLAKVDPDVELILKRGGYVRESWAVA